MAWYSVCMKEGKGIGAGHIVWIVVGVVVLVGVVVGLWYMDKQAAPEREAYASLAQCLTDRGVTFYSAFWCPNCAAQKALFKGSSKKLPHRECSLPDRSQNEFCEDAGIENYPTWGFADGTRCIGVVAPEVLAHVAGCPLPVYDGSTPTVDSLYTQLVADWVTDRYKRQGISAEDIVAAIAAQRDAIDAYLAEQYQSSMDEIEDVSVFLDAVVSSVYGCNQYGGDAEVTEEVSESSDS